MPVVPDLAQTVKLASDHSENLIKGFRGAQIVFSVKNSRIFFESCMKLIYINIIFLKKVVFMVDDVIRGWVTTFSSQLQTSDYTRFSENFIKKDP